MYIDSFSKTDKNKRLDKILKTLSEMQGMDMSFLKELDQTQLENLYETVNLYNKQCLYEYRFNTYNYNQDYTSNSLLKEALRLVLSEFAPLSRRKVKRKKKKKTNEDANYIVFSKDGIPVHSQADENQARVSAEIWDDPHKHRMSDTVVAKGPIETFFTPDWKNPVEEYERDWPIEDEIDTVDGYGLPTENEIGRWDYPENELESEPSPGTEDEKAISYVQAEHPDQKEIGQDSNHYKCATGQPYSHPALDQSDQTYINEGEKHEQTRKTQKTSRKEKATKTTKRKKTQRR